MSLKRKRKAGPHKATEPLSKRAPQFAAKATTASQTGDLASAAQRDQRPDQQGTQQSVQQKETSETQVPQQRDAFETEVAQLGVPEVSRQSPSTETRKEAAEIREGTAETQEAAAGTQGEAQLNTDPAAQDEACQAARPAAQTEASQAADPANQAEVHQAAHSANQAEVHQATHPADQVVAHPKEGRSLHEEGRRVAPLKDQKTSAETSSERRKKRPSARALRKVIFWVLALLCLVLVCISALFCWHRWLRYDDLADFQGEWSVEGTSGTISIDAEFIYLTSSDEFSYELDTGAKTLGISFGNLEGNARYRFSLDRTQLVIQDGSYDFFTSLFDDITWTFASLFSLLTGQEAPALAFDENSQVLTRVGSNTDDTDASADEDSSDSSSTDTSEEETTEASGEGETEEDTSDTSADDATGANSSDTSDESSDTSDESLDTSVTEALSSGSENEVGSNAVSPEDVQ